jgi:hypothetical protein
MGKIKTKIDCCGSNFENSNITLVGLFTLSAPLVIMVSTISLLLFPFNFLSIIKRLRVNLNIIARANLKLIDQYNLLPALRCSVAAFISKLSPSFSQVTYNSFNMTLLTIVWVTIITGASLIV